MNKHNCQHLRAWVVAVVTMIAATLSAQVEVEYFIDTDPGLGKAIKATTTLDADGNINFSPSAQSLSPGIHVLGWRAFQMIGGIHKYAPTIMQEFYVPYQNDAIKVTYAEYFFDTDPGKGNGTPIAFAVGKEVNLQDVEISTADLAPGIHKVGIRAFGSLGWGPTLLSDVNVTQKASDLSLLSAEYFFDTDPGFGQGTPISITTGHELTVDGLGLALNGLSSGSHLLGIRYQGTNGWSATYTTSFAVPVGGADAVASAEYFFDTDPGFGQGTPISITAGQEVSVDGLGLALNGLSSGSHLLGIRYRGTNGWSVTYTTNFAVTDGDGSSIATAEYFWNEDPGFGMGTPIALTPGEEVTLEDVVIPTYDVHGDAVLFIRYRGSQGWSPTISFSIAAEAEGFYTLNAAAATDAPTRSYQTLGDAIADFADRGVGSDITLNVITSNTNYPLDATSDAVLAQFTTLGESLDYVTSPRDEKTIAFTAEEGSGNTLAITTTAAGLPAVVGAMAHTTTENVALTINGTAYDFTPAASRHDEICGGTATTARALGQISTAITAKWAAQPHNNTTIGGYLISGEGNLPAMTLNNSGAKLDSLAYGVALTDGNGDTLTAYTYYIYVHPRVSNSTFSTLSPADGTVVYPCEQTIQWNTQAEVVGGYRLSISRVPLSDETAEPVVTNIDTDQKSYRLTVEEGYRYTWTVTAYGYCDELTSAARTIYGRSLEIDASDFAALQQLYTDFNGNSWNGQKWNITSSRITTDNSNWSGVTFDAYGRVTGINLSRRGLVGNTLNAETLAPMTALATLNLSYNQIDEITGLLSTGITSMDLSYQHRAYNDNTTWPGLESIASQTVTVGQNGSVVLTDVISYNHAAQNFNEHPTLDVFTRSYTQLGTLTWSAVISAYTFSAGNRQLTTEQDADVVLIASGDKCGRGSAMPATLHFVRGDANLSGLVDVNDVQRTLNYVLGTSTYSTFGLWSANTYTDYETEPVINIQDIVCTVDIVLDEQQQSEVKGERFDGRRKAHETDEITATNVFYVDGRSVKLYAEDEVAAFDLELEGVSASQVRLMLNGRDWQMTARNTSCGVRLIVFSPTGETLPIGTTELLRLGANAVPVAVQATSPEAETVDAAISDNLPTGILSIYDRTSDEVYDLSGRIVKSKSSDRRLPRGVYIVNGKKYVKKQ